MLPAGIVAQRPRARRGAGVMVNESWVLDMNAALAMWACEGVGWCCFVRMPLRGFSFRGRDMV